MHRVHWFNTERPHEALEDLTTEKVEQLHYARKQPCTSRVTQETQSPDTPGMSRP